LSNPNRRIYGDYDALVPILVLGHEFVVPEGIPLIRAFQYIQFELQRMESDWSRFCFNDTIGCCHFEFRPPQVEDDPEWGRACVERVRAGLEVHTLPVGSFLLDADGTRIGEE
jgi:hypothetical protein